VTEESSISAEYLITLTDDNGDEHDFVVIDAFHVDEKRYAILLPVYNSEDDGDEVEVDFEEDAYIFRVEMEPENGEEILIEVDDDAEWERVAAAWERRLKMLNEEDSDDYC